MTMEEKVKLLKNISSDGFQVLSQRMALPHFTKVVETADKTGLLYVARHVTPKSRFMMRDFYDKLITFDHNEPMIVQENAGSGKLEICPLAHVFVESYCGVMTIEHALLVPKGDIRHKLLPHCQVFTFLGDDACCKMQSQPPPYYEMCMEILGKSAYDDEFRKQPIEVQIEAISAVARKHVDPVFSHKLHIIPQYSEQHLREMAPGL